MTSAEQFRTNVEAFLEACEVLQANGLWEEAEYGNIQAYYVNDLVCIITRIIAADGKITESETKLLGDVFGFDYSVEELQEVYDICAEYIAELFDTGVSEAYGMLKEKDENLAMNYKELMIEAGNVAMDSDNMIMISEKEKEAVQKLQELLGK